MKILSLQIKVLFLFLGMLSLMGCGGGLKYLSHKVNEQAFCNNNKAIVITKVYGRHKPLIGHESEYRSAYSFAKLDSNYPNIKTRERYRVNEAPLIWPDYEVLMLDPGEYVVEELCYNFGDTNYYSSAEGYIPDSQHVIYARFTVKPNEVVYLGNLELEPKKIGRSVRVLNSYDDAAKYFYKKYPCFAREKIINRNYITCENPFPVAIFGEKIVQTVVVPVYY